MGTQWNSLEVFLKALAVQWGRGGLAFQTI